MMKGTLVALVLLFSVCFARPSLPSTFHTRVSAQLTSGSAVWNGAGLYALDLEKGFARKDFTLFGSKAPSVINIHTLDRYDVERSFVIDMVNFKCQDKKVTGNLANPLQWIDSASFVGESEYNGVTVENWEYKSGSEYHGVSVKKGTNEPVMFTERVNIFDNSTVGELLLTVREWSTQASKESVRFIPNHCLNVNNFGDVNAVVYFANANWNCGDIACSYTVPYNSPQPGYACAEFVSRCLAYGGYLPGLGATDPQSSYSGYSYGGNSYSLIDTTGLSPCLGALGWTKLASAYSSVNAGVAAIGDGGDGYFSHANIGVGPQVIDAHNWAVNNLAVNYDFPGGVDAAWAPPGSPSTSYLATQQEIEEMKGGFGVNAMNLEKVTVKKSFDGISVAEEVAIKKF